MALLRYMRKRRRLKFLAPHPLMVTFLRWPPLPQPTEQSEIHHPFLVGRPWPLSLSLPLKSNLKIGFPLLLCPPPPPLPARRPFRHHIKENGKFAFKQQVLFTYLVLRTVRAHTHTQCKYSFLFFPYSTVLVYCAAILLVPTHSPPPWGRTLQPV